MEVILPHKNQNGWKGEHMKLLSVKIDDELHKKLKIYAANKGRTVTDIIIELVNTELKTKKEQSL